MSTFKLSLIVLFVVGMNAALALYAWEERHRFRDCIRTYSVEKCR